MIVFTDTADALFACDAPEMLRRFEAADADVLTAWRGDSGAIIGRASKMLELIRDFEAFLNEPTGKGVRGAARRPGPRRAAAWADFTSRAARARTPPPPRRPGTTTGCV